MEHSQWRKFILDASPSDAIFDRSPLTVPVSSETHAEFPAPLCLKRNRRCDFLDFIHAVNDPLMRPTTAFIVVVEIDIIPNLSAI